jgi:hypothetical protein
MALYSATTATINSLKQPKSKPLASTGLGSGVTYSVPKRANPVASLSAVSKTSKTNYSTGQPTINPYSGLGAAVKQQPINPRSGAVTNINKINPKSGAGTNVKLNPYAGTQTGKAPKAKSKSGGVTLPTDLSQGGYLSPAQALQLADLYGSSTKAGILAQSALDASTGLANIALQRADVQAAVKAAEADGNAAMAHLAEMRRAGMDDKVYYLKVLEIQNQVNDRKTNAVNNGIETARRQNPLLDASEADVGSKYQLTLQELADQKSAADRGVVQNRATLRQNAAGGSTLGVQGARDADSVEKDYSEATNAITRNTTQAGTDYHAALRDLNESRAQVNDTLKQSMLDLADVQSAKAKDLLDTQHAIAEIDSKLRDGAITAKQAQDQTRIARERSSAQQAALTQQAQAIQRKQAADAQQANDAAAMARWNEAVSLWQSGAVRDETPQNTPAGAGSRPGAIGAGYSLPATSSPAPAAPAAGGGYYPLPGGASNPFNQYARPGYTPNPSRIMQPVTPQAGLDLKFGTGPQYDNPMHINNDEYYRIIGMVPAGLSNQDRFMQTANLIKWYSTIAMQQEAQRQAAAQAAQNKRHGG